MKPQIEIQTKSRKRYAFVLNRTPCVIGLDTTGRKCTVVRVCQNDDAIIIDFGMCQKIGGRRVGGTPIYTPPEGHNSYCIASAAIDAFSFGIIF